MAGLMNPGAPPQDAALLPQPGAESDTVGDNEGVEQATPEEQAQYDAFVKLGRSLIGEKGEDVLDLLDEDPADLREILGDTELLQDPTPAVALAAAAVIVVMEAINRSPERPADDVIMHGGKELLETIAELGDDAGIHNYSQDELNQAWLHGMDLYREAASAEGQLDEDALKAQFNDIVSADKEGRLGEVLPELANAQVDPREAPAAEGDAPPVEEEEEEEANGGGLR